MSRIIGPVFGLKVPAGDDIIPATKFPASFRITMAAIDPTAQPKVEAGAEEPVLRATLKMIRERSDLTDEEDFDEEDIDDIDAIKARLGGILSDEEDDESSDDDEKNGGPSDPSRSKKAREEALKKALAKDEEMDVDNLTNGINGVTSKGKGKAVDLEGDSEEDEDEDDDGEEEDEDIEEFVLCTLDPTKNYQQTLDISIDEDEEVYFKVTGTHSIYLTGNYIFPMPPGGFDEDESSEDEYDMDYDIPPHEDEVEIDSGESSDELDALEDPRVAEVDSEEEEEVPKLVSDKKGKNKRPADESDEERGTLDALIGKSLKPAEVTTNGEKLSKKQLKKLKKNDGQPVSTAEEPNATKKDAKAVNGPTKSDKKVQFAKNLEQGPSGSPKVDGKADSKKDTKAQEETKPSGGTKVVSGVKIDDKKTGKGRAAKSGDKLGMRYIGKLESGKVFDSNKKGAPFKFTLGKGEVIKGWDVGVAGMAVGGERRITVPANMGYGSKKLPDIPANSTLVFDIKLLSIN